MMACSLSLAQVTGHFCPCLFTGSLGYFIYNPTCFGRFRACVHVYKNIKSKLADS